MDRNFLVDRKQYVAVDGSTSVESSVISEVLQGSVFISDLNEGLLNSATTSFADDTRVMKPVSAVSMTVRSCRKILSEFMIEQSLITCASKVPVAEVHCQG